jgi:hypothetical protein
MATLNIEGRKVTVDDSFMKLSPDEQNATVEEIAKTLTPAAAAAPSVLSQAAAAAPAEMPKPPAPAEGGKGFLQTADDLVRSLANGMTFGLADRFAAAASSATGIGAQPQSVSDLVTGNKNDYAGNLERERRRTDEFAKEHPIVSTGTNLAGGLVFGADRRRTWRLSRGGRIEGLDRSKAGRERRGDGRRHRIWDRRRSTWCG